MSGLSGYDSEVVGFESVSADTNPRATSSAQTTEYAEREAAAQTGRARDVGCTARPDECGDGPAPATPPGLQEFLRRVAPLVFEQLGRTDPDFLDTSSESDEDESPTAKLIQEIAEPGGSGDGARSVLSVSWSGGGDSLAVARGRLVHDTWCRCTGGVTVYAYRRSEERFVTSLELTEASCVTALRYHPRAPLLAYGTAAGAVVMHVTAAPGESPQRLAALPQPHDARRVSALHWADAAVAESFLLMQIKNKKKRRGAADQVLLSSGCNGTVSAWQVNAGGAVFEHIIGYRLLGSRAGGAPDVTCFDFAKASSPRAGDRGKDHLFVAGTSDGRLLLCSVTEAADPVLEELAGRGACVLDVAFSPQRPLFFVSLCMDSELRVYDVSLGSLLKVVSPGECVSCVRWLDGACVLAGLGGADGALRVYGLTDGRALPVAGLAGQGHVTCLDVSHRGLRVAAGDKDGTIKVWDLPPLRNKWNCDHWM